MLKVYTYNINVLSFWIWGFYWWPAFFNTSVCVVMDLGCYSCPSRSSTSHTLSIAKPFTSIHRGLECNLCLWKIIFSSFQRKKISLKKKKSVKKIIPWGCPEHGTLLWDIISGNSFLLLSLLLHLQPWLFAMSS